MKRKILATIIGVAMVMGSFTACGSKGTATGGNYKVYLITMDQTDQYWANMDEGCQQAVEDLAGEGITVDYKWSAPDKKDDAQQIEKINNAVADGAQAILLAANDPTAVNAALEEASAAGVKIVYVDSPADFEAVRTLSTDNEAAGKTAAETLIQALDDQGITSGDIGIIGVNTSTNSTMERENGFRSAFEGTDFNLFDTLYCEGDYVLSQNNASNLLAQGCVGLYGCDKGSTVGLGKAIEDYLYLEDSDARLVGVGFDTCDEILDLIDQEYLITMVPNPATMGYEGIKTAVNAINGKKTGDDLDTGVTAVSKDNLADFK